MRAMLISLLVLGVCGCGGDDPTPSAKTPDVATPLPDLPTVKKTLTPAQLAVGDPIENSVSMVLVPIPAGEFMMGSPESEPGRRDGLGREVQH